MSETKSTARSRSPNKIRIKLKNKSYSLKDSGLYNITTKKRLESLLDRPFQELEQLSDDSNYQIFYLTKPDGAKREIQAPTLKLDILQTRIASLLGRIAMPEFIHSGVKGRSYITNAKAHMGEHPVLTMDIRNFYPSITKKSIYNFFHNTMNASPDVAGILAAVCTFQNHIPTGSRISMPLSFWANQQMFHRLYSLCKQKNVTMSIYVDDLTFSGKSVNKLFMKHVKEIIESSGFMIHPRKTRLFLQHQPKLITGVMVHANHISIRNKHHKEIYSLFNEMKCVSSDEELEKLQRELIGRLNAAGQIESIFKQRARNASLLFRPATESIVA